jgi:Secretion system C-terminal sorting domain
MKKMKKVYFYFLLIFINSNIDAQNNYTANGNSGFAGAIGLSNLTIADNGTTVTFSLTKGAGAFNDYFVLYIDSKTGGSSNTNGLNDQQDAFRRATSGIDGGNVSRVNFPATPIAFLPDYAITLNASSAALFDISNTSNFGYTNANLTISGLVYTFTATKAALGITGASINFNFIGTYVSGTAFRSNEGYGNGLPGSNPGNTNVTFSSFLSYPLVVTPLNLNSFTGNVKDENISINWNTLSESNLSKFILLKSTNGLSFITIGEVTPTNAANGAYYTFVDNSPNKGNNYYRLMARNNSGSSSYSKIVKVVYGQLDNNLTIFPNPAKEGDVLNINLASSFKGTFAINIYADNGQLLIQQNVEHNGTDKIVKVTLPSNLKKGPYRINISNDYEFFKGTFIVQ